MRCSHQEGRVLSVKSPKFTDEELRILDDIDVHIGKCDGSLADIKSQRQKFFSEMKRIIDNYSGNESLARMEEMMGEIRKTQVSEERYYAEEDALMGLRDRMMINVCRRDGVAVPLFHCR